MKLKDYINKKVAQAYDAFVADDETFDQIFEDLVMDVEKLFPKEQQDDIYQKLIDRLKLYIGAE